MRFSKATLCLITLSASACSGWDGPRPEEVATRSAIAPQATQVLQITFKASSSGYTVVDMRRTAGAPTLAIDQNRDVLITAVDSKGNSLGSVSVFNPRLVQTTGSRDPDSALLDEATFTINFADPDAINALDLRVVRGPDGEYHAQFLVKEHSK